MTVQTLYLGRERAIPGLTFRNSGKVRDIYALDDEHLLFVTTDRVSAFDVVMNEGIPHKGARADARSRPTGSSARATSSTNHLVATRVEDVPGARRASWRERLRGRVMLVRRAAADAGRVGRARLPRRLGLEGVPEDAARSAASAAGRACSSASRLPEPILTPTTKDEHARPAADARRGARARRRGRSSTRREQAALALFAARHARCSRKLGILLADTKFEFGLLRRQAAPDRRGADARQLALLARGRVEAGRRTRRATTSRSCATGSRRSTGTSSYPPPTLDPAVLERTGRALPRDLRADHRAAPPEGVSA